MKREFLRTGDGSITIHLPEWNEQYHSRHGAIAEAVHVFIKNGLYEKWASEEKEISILEMGFGTGLNCYLSLLEAERRQSRIEYTGIEAYPVEGSEISQLNYPQLLDDSGELFEKIHRLPWEVPTEITANFQLLKKQLLFERIDEVASFNLIYFDAFGPRVQPDLWTEKIFQSMFDALKPNGILVTYSAKGDVRRVMQKVGFRVERLPGPPGKREMLRAVKGDQGN